VPPVVEDRSMRGAAPETETASLTAGASAKSTVDFPSRETATNLVSGWKPEVAAVTM
jgi:hypothetical protein